MSLYHFTCDHGHAGLIEEGHTLPIPQPVLGELRLSWFTSAADGVGTGLDPETVVLDCDRLEHRFRAADPTELRPWVGSIEQASMDPMNQFLFQALGDPDTWYISREPVSVEYDPT